jgi:hypothetical protein
MILKYETIYKLAFENGGAVFPRGGARSPRSSARQGPVARHAGVERAAGDRWSSTRPRRHGLTFLTVPEVFLRLVSEGPLARDMRSMMSLLADPANCSICIVTLPEEMPANEAIELDRALRQHHFPPGPLFLNEVFDSRFKPQEVAAVTRGGPLLAAAGEAADNHESPPSLPPLRGGPARLGAARAGQGALSSATSGRRRSTRFPRHRGRAGRRSTGARSSSLAPAEGKDHYLGRAGAEGSDGRQAPWCSPSIRRGAANSLGLRNLGTRRCGSKPHTFPRRSSLPAVRCGR